MRSKTFVLGSISLVFVMFVMLFVSATDRSANPGAGYNPGECVPSIKVDDIDLQEMSADGMTLVVLWSKCDAKSRVVNSWLSGIGSPHRVISVCVDADTEEAMLYAEVDGVSDDTLIKGGNQSEELLKALGMTKELKSLMIEDGIIVNVTPIITTWEQLANTKSNFSES